MPDFLSITFGDRDYKLLQLVCEDGKLVQKASDIVFWVVIDTGNGILHSPISKIDMENNKTIVLSQLVACYNDHTRILLKTTKDGMVVIPYSGIQTL